MKNRKFEKLRASAKRWAKSGARGTANAVVHLPHVYEEPYRTLSWWDDFGFRLGSQWVSVWWIHPRMRLKEEIESKALDLAELEIPYQRGKGLGEESTPNYKKVGRSRKKAVSYTWKPSHWNDAYFQRVKEIEKELENSPAEVTASLHIRQYGHCRGIDLCYPVELRNKEEIVAFAAKVKAHLKGELDLFAGMDEYRYTTQNLRDDLALVEKESANQVE